MQVQGTSDDPFVPGPRFTCTVGHGDYFLTKFSVLAMVEDTFRDISATYISDMVSISFPCFPNRDICFSTTLLHNIAVNHHDWVGARPVYTVADTGVLFLWPGVFSVLDVDNKPILVNVRNEEIEMNPRDRWYVMEEEEPVAVAATVAAPCSPFAAAGVAPQQSGASLASASSLASPGPPAPSPVPYTMNLVPAGDGGGSRAEAGVRQAAAAKAKAKAKAAAKAAAKAKRQAAQLRKLGTYNKDGPSA
jgi:hypothetical protein